LRDRLEQFASYISHDLQNPLNLASGHLKMAREGGDEAALDTAAAALDQRTVSLTDSVRPGLAVSSAVPGDPCEATFSTVRAYELE